MTRMWGSRCQVSATIGYSSRNSSDHLSAELSASADSLRPRPTPALSTRPHRAENLRAAINPNTQTNATPMAKIVVAFANPTVAARNPAPMAGTDMNT